MAVLTKRGNQLPPEHQSFSLSGLTVLVTGFSIATIFSLLDDSPKECRADGLLAIAMSPCSTPARITLPSSSRALCLHAETAYNAVITTVLSSKVVGPSLILLSIIFAAAHSSRSVSQRLLTFLSGVVLMISYTVVVPSRPTSFYSAASPSPGTAYRTAGFGSTSRWYPTGGDANRLAATASASSAGMQMFRQHAAGACGGYKGERFAEAMGRAVRVSITSGTCICQDLWHLGQQSADRPPAMELFMDYTVA
ncbi:hypothetical protein HPP92_013809 [Vanilla planifolia]|uniref:Uncharacterized protein n=1 Tax=Vanilla planifolia TaxID=51239 RepID=A0A835QSZ3_VANPL|nr:hypothetical protein HPP92_013809 [Vanilla planifolia]